MASDNGIEVGIESDILRVTIQREAQLNALSIAILSQIEAIFSEFAANLELKAAVICGAGEHYFAAGGDLKELDAYRDRKQAEQMVKSACAALDAIRNFPVPVIAGLNGDALGGGAELALACDMRLFAAHAKIAYLQSKLNILPSWGGVSDLIETVGHSHAIALLSSNRFVEAPEALSLGIAQYIAPRASNFDRFIDSQLEPIRNNPAHIMRALKRFRRSKKLADDNHSADFRALENELAITAWLDSAHWEAAAPILESMAKKT